MLINKNILRRLKTPLTSAISQALAAISFCSIALVCILMFVSCASSTAPTGTEVWYQEGPITYTFPNAYRCIAKIDDQTYNIPKSEKIGSVGELLWAWRDNGDVYLKYFDDAYNLTNPYDYDPNLKFEGYESIGNDTIMIWLGDQLVTMPKSFLKDHPEYNKQFIRDK